MDISTSLNEVRVGIYENRRISAAKQRPIAPGAQVDQTRESARQKLHGRGEMTFPASHEQMIMICHEAIGVHLPAGLLAGFGQGLSEVLPVNVVQENSLAPVTTAPRRFVSV